MAIEIISIENITDVKTRLDKYLANNCELSRSRIEALIDEGCVKVDGVVVNDASYKVKLNQKFEITVPEPVEDELSPENIDIDIIYQDEYLLVINKRAGMVVHPAAGNWQGTLVNALLYHVGDSLSGIGGVKRPGIVHRLDKDDKTHQKLSEQFANREVKKEYLAIVNGVIKPPSGLLETNIGRSPRNRQKQAVLKHGGKNAITEYNLIKTFNEGEYSLISVKIHTGRTHQIRVHMAHLGHSILGDELYGKKNNKYIQRQALHAYKVSFLHPISGEKCSFEAKIPEDMQQLLL